ncbi:spondin domain-containing protein [Arhodomonas sp. AD133]|uniref:spondin domain-containing protein n=1 Tax=Arhodomonas sp. AD133 TaxID=3415009 RepID=UPI003EBAC591
MQRVRTSIVGIGVALALGTGGATAAEFDISIHNLTRGIWLTPLLVAAHSSDTGIFEPGTSASLSLQAMAEGGNIAPLADDLEALGASVVTNPSGAPVTEPGTTTTLVLATDNAAANTQLSIVAMMLPTNDGFIGLNAVSLPVKPGTHVFHVNAYDAGTEGNDEVRGSGVPNEPGIPVPPPMDPVVDSGGSGLAAAAEGFVHVHRGQLGDTNPTGGATDVDSRRQRWLNPVVRITVSRR